MPFSDAIFGQPVGGDVTLDQLRAELEAAGALKSQMPIAVNHLPPPTSPTPLRQPLAPDVYGKTPDVSFVTFPMDESVQAPAFQHPPAPQYQANPYPPQEVAAPAQQPQRQPQQSGVFQRMRNAFNDPNIRGPLQTFLQSVAQPLGHGESGASRIARAVALADIHKTMLAENERDRPLAEAKAALENREKMADVGFKEARAKYEPQRMEQDLLNSKQSYETGKLDQAGKLISNDQNAFDLDFDKKTKMNLHNLEVKHKLASISATQRSNRGSASGGDGLAKSDMARQRKAAATMFTSKEQFEMFLADPALSPEERAQYPKTKAGFTAWLRDNSMMNSLHDKTLEAAGTLLEYDIDPYAFVVDGWGTTPASEAGGPAGPSPLAKPSAGPRTTDDIRKDRERQQNVSRFDQKYRADVNKKIDVTRAALQKAAPGSAQHNALSRKLQTLQNELGK